MNAKKPSSSKPKFKTVMFIGSSDAGNLKNRSPDKLTGKKSKSTPHLLILPYPRKYEKTVILKDGQRVFLRPIRPEDAPMEREMFKTFSKETERFRFFGPVGSITHKLLVRLTQVDYAREIAIIAELRVLGKKKMLGVVRLIINPKTQKAEFAIVISDPWQNRGLGNMMMDYMLEIAEDRGIAAVFAYLLVDNYIMLHMFRSRGFSVKHEEDTYRVEKLLQ